VVDDWKNAVVLLSGGLDSATVLAIARDQGYRCIALSFDYGQRHRVEIISAKQVASAGGAAEHRILTLPIGELGGSALTDKTIDVPDASDTKDTEIPITYVPARNTIFLSMALGRQKYAFLHKFYVFCRLHISVNKKQQLLINKNTSCRQESLLSFLQPT